MCGSLRLERKTRYIHDPIQAYSPTGEFLGSFKWEGFAREDSIQKGVWNHRNPQEAVIKATEYNEKGVQYLLKGSQAIQALITDGFIEGERQIRIVTRPITRDETITALNQGKLPHSRHPKLISVSPQLDSSSKS